MNKISALILFASFVASGGCANKGRQSDTADDSANESKASNESDSPKGSTNAKLALIDKATDEDLAAFPPDVVFQNWSKFKVGTSVTRIKRNTFFGPNDSQKLTFKLVEKKDDQVKIEFSVPKVAPSYSTYDKGQHSGLPELYIFSDDEADESGIETLEIKGTSIKCKWYFMKFEDDGTEVKAWFSTSVPGLLVKLIQTTKMPETRMTIDLEEVNIVD